MSPTSGSPGLRTLEPPADAAPTGRGSGRLGGIIRHTGLIAFAIFMLYPVLWMISSSFKPDTVIFSSKGLWPTEFTLANYVDGWTGLDPGFAVFFGNSLLITVLCIIGNLVACSITAYAFARLRFPARSILFATMMITIMLPSHAVVVPQYLLFSWLGWINTILPLVVPKFLATDAFFIFLMMQFIRGLPRELDDAAKLDGCGPISTFFRILLPMMVPALATTSIFTFIWTWNEFFSPLLYLNTPDQFTVPLALKTFQDSAGETSWGALFAMSTLAIGPILGFFILCQRFLVRGIATTGLKG